VSQDLRAFVAIDPPDAFKRAAADAAEPLRARLEQAPLRWAPSDRYHVTLRFLGRMERSSLPELREALSAAVADHDPWTASLGEPAGFPSPRRARVLVLGLEPAEPMIRLAAAVEEAVQSVGFEPETRDFRPHLTLARSRKRPVKLGELPAVAPAEFPVTGITVFESLLGGEGSTYVPLERIGLAEPDSG